MNRIRFLQKIEDAFQVTPIVAVLGPRQCGKTTIAKDYFHKHQGNISNYFDLEDNTDIARLLNPKLALMPLHGLIIIDEIQKTPNLFTTLRVLIDNNTNKQKYLILGSASRELIKQSAETLAGRVSYIELTPFSLFEVENLDTLWWRGGFPNAYLALNDSISYAWREQYIRTFLEQDIPALGINIPTQQLRRFWMMLCHYHGNIFNASELGRSLNLSYNTIKKYLDILVGTFMIRSLQPWFQNISKRQVKSPKIYFRDSGIFHNLNNIKNPLELQTFSKIGASWEGFALEEVIRAQNIDANDCYFWATHAGAELDLLVIQGQNKIGYEFKYSDAPKITKSMHVALETLRLKELNIIIPGKYQFSLDDKIYVKGLDNFAKN